MLDSRSSTTLHKGLVDYFRSPEHFFEFDLLGGLSACSGFFRFGSNRVCYGRSCTGLPSETFNSELYDVLRDVQVQGTKCLIPFDPVEVVDNLRKERYVRGGSSEAQAKLGGGLARRAYYYLRPHLRTTVRKYLQRAWLRGWERRPFPAWPVDRTADRIHEQLLLLAMKAQGRNRIPFIWFWPDGKSACTVMTHDVETRLGLEYCPRLMDLNDFYGIKSSFQIIPVGRYQASDEILREIRTRGFEISIHDWNHDGFLYSDRDTFLVRAKEINRFAFETGAEGFRSGALYRNVNWYDAFTVAYDMSVPNVGHLDPQPGGCCTVMPYFIGKILEIPVTATQDYSLFHILDDYSIDLWKRQISLIREGHGLASFIVHPDYIIEDRARAIYSGLLEYLSRLRSEQNVWTALPGEVNRWWRERSQMKLVQYGGEWRIEGPGSERARIAYAVSDGQELVYSLN